MNKRITLLITLMLISILALAACGSSKPTEDSNIVNLPVIDAGGSVGTEAPEIEVETEPETPVAVTYPIEVPEIPEIMIAYPIDPTAADYDKQMEEYLKQLFGEKHTIEELLAKDLTAEQWREVLTNEKHLHLGLGEGALQVIIDWFTSK